jgi:hypothetical protein
MRFFSFVCSSRSSFHQFHQQQRMRKIASIMAQSPA